MNKTLTTQNALNRAMFLLSEALCLAEGYCGGDSETLKQLEEECEQLQEQIDLQFSNQEK